MRDYGTGSLRLKGNVWYVVARNAQGKQVSRRLIDPVTGKKPTTKAHASRLAAQEAARIAGQRSDELIRLQDLFDRYLKAQGRHLHPETVRNRRSAMDRFIERFPKIAMINQSSLGEWARERVATPTHWGTKRKPSAVNREISFLRTVLAWGEVNKLIRENPMRGFQFFREENHRERVLSADEEQRLLDAVLQPQFDFVRPIVYIALYMGMRRSEIFSLRWDNLIDLGGGRKGFYLLKTKSGKKRIVPIPVFVYEQLPEQVNEWVFPSPKTGKPLDNIRKSWRSLLNLAGIEDFRFHDLRHCAATKMAGKGVHPRVMQEIFGWSSLSMVERYTNPLDQEKIRALDSAFD